jgi:trimeric autotransporter adhesin
MKTNYGKHVVRALALVLIILLATPATIACSSGPAPSSTVTQAAPAKLVFITQPAGAPAGAQLASQPVVAVQDGSGNIVNGYRTVVSLTITGSTPETNSLYGGTIITSTSGVINFKELSVSKAGTYTLTATSSNLASAVSNSFVITPVEGAKLVFSRNTIGASAGSALASQPAITVLDMYGNTSVGSTAEVSLALKPITPESYAAVLSGTVSVKAVNGVVDFTGLSVDIAGSYILIAFGAGFLPAQSNVFDITPGAPVDLFFNSQPLTTTPGSPLTVMPPAIPVLVRDMYGNTVNNSSAEVTVTITPGTGAAGAVLSGTTKLKAANGVASFLDLSIDKLGKGYTLTATSSGLTSAVSDPFDITSTAPGATSANTTSP